MVQISANHCKSPYKTMLSDGAVEIFLGDTEYLNHLKLSELGKTCFFLSFSMGTSRVVGRTVQ